MIVESNPLLRIVEEMAEGVARRTLGRIGEMSEPDRGENMGWHINGVSKPGPRISENQPMATHGSDIPGIFESFTGLLESEPELIGDFTGGIPLLYEAGSNHPVLAATLYYWYNQESPPTITPDISNYNPYLKRLAAVLVDATEQLQNDGLWVDTASSIERETAESPVLKMHYIMPWEIRNAKWNQVANGDEMYDLKLKPLGLLQGFAKELPLHGIDPFANGYMPALFHYEVSIKELRAEQCIPGIEKFENDGTELVHLLQYISPVAGFKWKYFPGFLGSGGANWPHFMWTKTPDFVDMFKIEHLTVPKIWDINDECFAGDDGFSLMFRAKVSKARRYGDEGYVYRSKDTDRFMTRPTHESIIFDTLTEYSEVSVLENAEEEDSEWGTSSRFVPSFQDKRKLKIIDKTNGDFPYWSDVIRCKICNGQVKVILREKPTTVIFDCPHCGEGGCIDCTHLQPGVEWPTDKKRKVLKSK